MAVLPNPFRQSKVKSSQPRGRRAKPRRRFSLQPLEQRWALDATGVSPSSSFVTAAFQEILVREVDQASLTTFSTALQDGSITRLTFTETLTHSVEYFSNIVSADYSQFLGRAPDAAGLAFWDNLMSSGMTDGQLAAQFIGSPEFFAQCGGTNQGWVDQMYFDLLGRSPDLSGEAAWVNALNAGMSRSLAAFGFASCAEREAIIVREDYQVFLGRQASNAEVAGWVNQFGAGMSNENIIAGFCASDEFINNAATQLAPTGAGSGNSTVINSGSGNIIVNIGSVNIINSGNINSGNVNINSGNVNSGNVNVNSGNVNLNGSFPHHHDGSDGGGDNQHGDD